MEFAQMNGRAWSEGKISEEWNEIKSRCKRASRLEIY